MSMLYQAIVLEILIFSVDTSKFIVLLNSARYTNAFLIPHKIDKPSHVEVSTNVTSKVIMRGYDLKNVGMFKNQSMKELINTTKIIKWLSFISLIIFKDSVRSNLNQDINKVNVLNKNKLIFFGKK